MGSAVREWMDILIGIPWNSILVTLRFNIFVNDLIMSTEKTDICNFTDKSTL